MEMNEKKQQSLRHSVKAKTVISHT